MNVRIIYQTHKWLGAVALAASLAWFISGAVMVLPGRWRTLSPGMMLGADAEAMISSAPAFEEARVSVPEAIAAVRAKGGTSGRIGSVRLRRFPGRLAYQIVAADGTHLVDATSGTIFTIDAAMAAQITRQALGPNTGLGPVTVQRQPTNDYRGPGPFPVYRVPAADGKGTVFYVNGTTGDTGFSDRRSRIFTSIVNWHDFYFIDSVFSNVGVRFSNVGVRWTLFAFAILGTLTSMAGALILLVQVQRWQRGRKKGRVASRDL